MEPRDEHYVDLPQAGAEAKILKWNERIAQGLTAKPRSDFYIIGVAQSGKKDEVGVYLRRNPATH
jgi:hypothetical protein